MLQQLFSPHATDKAGNARLIGRVVPRATVDANLANQLFRLFADHYLQVDRATFDRDQAEKDWVLLLSDPSGTVRGFTTMQLYELEIDGRPLRAIFSGNTIIQRDYWGEQELVESWCRFMTSLKQQKPTLPLYWFLICSGYRTYLYLPLFFEEFFPRHDRETPEREQRLLDALGQSKYPSEYRDGVVQVARPRECLRPELAVPEAHKLRNSHVAFFLARNPGWQRGDELVCLTEFSVANTKRKAHRIARETLLPTLELP